MTSPFVPLCKPAREDSIRLFCFPYSGGGAAVFRNLAAALPPFIEPVAVRLPGRESRFGELPYDRMEPVVEHLLHRLPPWLERPYACFGFSMGSRVALALTQAVERHGLQAPAALFMGGSPGPSLPLDVPGWNDNDDILTTQLRGLGGIPPQVQAQPELIELMVPTLRADLSVVATWPYQPHPITAPIHALAGTNDEYASPARMAAWAQETRGKFWLTTVPGGHFFLHTQTRKVALMISDALTSMIPQRRSSDPHLPDAPLTTNLPIDCH